MKRIIKNITSTIVAIAILFSTLSLQIYTHSCKSHNFFAASFIEKPECEKDHLAEEIDDCCKTEEIEEVSCCDVEINVSKDVVNSLSVDDVALIKVLKNEGGSFMITHKQYPNHHIFEPEIGGRTFTVETGKVAARP